MKKTGRRSLSLYDYVLLACTVPYNFLIYCCGRSLATGRYHFCFTTAIDKEIPLLPWTMIIYWGCYIFWAANYYLGVRYDESGRKQFIRTHYIGETVCFLLFVFLPTTMARPRVTGTTVFELMLRMQYSIDSATNLLPSIHCFASWLCWIGIRGNRNIPKWYRVFSLLFAVAVCISTLTVKQHVIADVFFSIALAETCYKAASLIWIRGFIRRKMPQDCTLSDKERS